MDGLEACLRGQVPRVAARVKPGMTMAALSLFFEPLVDNGSYYSTRQWSDPEHP